MRLPNKRDLSLILGIFLPLFLFEFYNIHDMTRPLAYIMLHYLSYIIGTGISISDNQVQ